MGTWRKKRDWIVTVRKKSSTEHARNRRNMGNMGTDGKFSYVSLRTSQKLQETFRLSPSFKFPKFPKFPKFRGNEVRAFNRSST